MKADYEKQPTLIGGAIEYYVPRLFSKQNDLPQFPNFEPPALNRSNESFEFLLDSVGMTFTSMLGGVATLAAFEYLGSGRYLEAVITGGVAIADNALNLILFGNILKKIRWDD